MGIEGRYNRINLVSIEAGSACCRVREIIAVWLASTPGTISGPKVAVGPEASVRCRLREVLMLPCLRPHEQFQF